MTETDEEVSLREETWYQTNTNTAASRNGGIKQSESHTDMMTQSLRTPDQWVTGAAIDIHFRVRAPLQALFEI